MLDRLLSGLPHAMLLEARDGQLAVLLPAGAAPRRAAIDAVAKLGASCPAIGKKKGEKRGMKKRG